LALNYFAYAYLLAAAAFTRIDAALEEAAMIHGASTATQLRLIVLPIILPALGSAFILTFAQGLGSFGVPAVLGFPDRYYVLSTILFQSAGVGRFSDAYILAFFLIAISALTIWANGALIGSRRQFTTVSGKGGRSRLTPLGRLGWPVAVVLIAFMLLVGVGPVALLALQSFQLRLDDFSLANLTLTYWTGYTDGFYGILVDPRVRMAAWNTIVLGLSVAVITAFVGVVIGYILVRERGTRFASLIEQLSFLPFLIPSVAFGLIYLSMFAQPRGPIPALYGTMAILILASAVNRLPFATRTGVSAMTQVSRSLEEAAEVHGAGLVARFRHILLPLTKHGFLAGFILSFVSTVKDLSLVILLVTPQTTVLTVLAYNYLDLGRPQFAYAVSLIVIAVVLVGTWLVQRVTKSDPFRGLGGAQ
jgi:iron(III) transport system permease protein